MSESPKKLSDRPMPNMAGLPDEPMPKCSVCRRPAGTNPACDRCASYRRMVRERDNPTEAERAAKREWETAFRMEQAALNAAAQARVSRLSGFTVSVGLVGCGKTKLKHVALAKDLYTSPLFRAARRYAERCCHEWVILSAGHHVLLPEQAVAPYERSLSKLRLREKEHWALIVTDYLKQHYARLDVRYIGLAGEDYLSLLGIPVERPLEGLGIGERIKRLHTMVSECSASERKVAARILDLMIERKRARLPDAQRSAAEVLWQRRRGLYLFLAESTVLAQRKGTAKDPSAEWAVEQLASELRTRSKAPQLTAWLTQRAPQLTGFCRAIWDDAFTDWLASRSTPSNKS